jgi:hypothetical protein
MLPRVKGYVQVSGIFERWYFEGKFSSSGIWEHDVFAGP